jgi:hypothetical protein
VSAPPTNAAPWSREQAALHRLAVTRARLTRALGHASSANASTTDLTPAPAGPLAQWASQGVIDLLAERWRQSPWRVSLQLADQAADTLLRPLARQHPVGLVLAAGAAGALVTLVRPWRWLPASPLLELWPLARRAIVRAASQDMGGRRPGPGPA